MSGGGRATLETKSPARETSVHSSEPSNQGAPLVTRARSWPRGAGVRATVVARSCGEGPGVAGGGTVIAGSRSRVGRGRRLAAVSSAARNSAAVWKRREGFFSSARMITSLKPRSVRADDLVGRGRDHVALLEQHGGHVLRGEGQGAGGQPVGDDPQRVEIDPPVDLLAVGLLRRHVLRRADDGARTGLHLGEIGEELGDAEVEHLHEVRVPAAAREEDVLRLEIAVDHAARVGRAEPLADLGEDGDGHLRGDDARGVRELRQRLALQVLHDEVVDRRGLHGHVEDADDVLVPDDVHRARLGEEARHEIGMHGEVRMEDLHRHLAADEHVLARGTPRPCHRGRADASAGSCPAGFRRDSGGWLRSCAPVPGRSRRGLREEATAAAHGDRRV